MDTVQRAEVVLFAYREARHTGSLDCMKAVVYVLRNRLKAGWGDGTWFCVMNGHREVAGNPAIKQVPLDAKDRLLQMMAREIDEIYVGSMYSDDTTRLVVGEALYYQFIDQEMRPWFVEKIVRDSKNHPRTGQIGSMALFGNPAKPTRGA